MTHNHNDPPGNNPSSSSARPQPNRGQKTPNWFAVVLVLCLLGIAWWQRSDREQRRQQEQTVTQSQRSESSRESRREQSIEKTDDDTTRHNEPIAPPVAIEPTPRSEKPTSSRDPLKIENQVIRDMNGRVVYRGEIDLTPTLDRIASGAKISHHNDGTSFQNRERKLPAKPHGYYTEYVHPTKGVGGPGPQRVIVGKDGEIWYTPDHYRTFERIK